MTNREIKTDCVNMVDDYLEVNPYPATGKELLAAVRSIQDLYDVGTDYFGPLLYEFEYRNHACYSSNMDGEALDDMAEAMLAEMPKAF